MFRKILNRVFSTSAAGLYMLLFATAIGVATFIENDFGTTSAQKLVFRARWFELLLLLFGICMIVNIFRFRMIQQKKWTIFTFHTAIIIILLGSAVTRYFGYEGMMHIREESSSNEFLSAETFLQFEALQNGQRFVFDEPVLFATLGNNNLKKSYRIGEDLIEVEVEDFIPNPAETIAYDENGVPILKIIMGGSAGREEHYIRKNEQKRIRNLLFNFTDTEIPGTINLKFENSGLFFKYNRPLSQMIMATQQSDTLNFEDYEPLMVRSLYSDGSQSFVVGDFSPSGKVELISTDRKMKSESVGGLKLNVQVNGEEDQLVLFGQKGIPGIPKTTKLGNTNLAIAYGSKRIFLPFEIKLHDFIMERYPGTNSASSYASEVRLIDKRKNLERDQRIYMNHILNYGGYRFFQSSYDKDELGTYLSVNHDAWGTWISYIGYGLLTLGMILTFFSRKSRFFQVSQKLKKIRKLHQAAATAILLLLTSSLSFGNSAEVDPFSAPVVDLDHAAKFGALVVQDHQGRMKPMNTLSREVLRKIARKESLYGLSPDQILLGMVTNPKEWNKIPLIKPGKHKNVKKLLGDNELLAFNDFFRPGGKYILQEEVRRAYNLQPIDRTMYEKELLKIDERVNIASMVFTGRFLKLFPIPGDVNNLWVSPADASHNHSTDGHSAFAHRFFPAYIPTVGKALIDNNWSVANDIVEELDQYQREYGKGVLPNQAKVNAEILLNNLNVFNRLALFYGLLGIGFLALMFTSVFKDNAPIKWPFKVLFGLVVLGFIFHTFGLGLRWYVSGRAPWSNGYESMIYIAWTTVLAGLLFTRKSTGGMAATMVLSATVLLVAMLSYLDPEITPLVPVLRSYWLTIHVSLEAGSYGFLMLGAIIGLLNLILMIFINQKNRERLARMIKEMSYISEMTLMGGLFMVSVGTYLGGVWANESWGRYWGWDAKETWALVTILIYAFILHMRFIPKINTIYAFSVASLFGWASVIMTYYGVNYYLSGLHSYATGDPVPLPNWVFYTIISLVIISVLAYINKRRVKFNWKL